MLHLLTRTIGIPLLLGSACDQRAPEPGAQDRPQKDGGQAEDTAKAIPAQAKRAAVATPAPHTLPGLPISGRPAPDLTLPDLSTGQPWSLASQADPTGESCPKGVLLAFMASWCTYCAQSLPTLVDLEKANPDLAVVTVTVDTTDQTRKAELDKVRKAGLTGPVLAADASTIQTWVGGDKSVPKYYFINHNGLLTGKDDGFGDKVGPLMPKQVERALAD